MNMELEMVAMVSGGFGASLKEIGGGGAEGYGLRLIGRFIQDRFLARKKENLKYFLAKT